MKPKLKLNILIAYPYFNNQILETLKNADIDYNLIIDSGAYSVWNSGKTITLDEYCSFLDKISKEIKITKAVQLDVFGNPEQTIINYDKMLQRGYDVMPVFTRGDTLETLEYFYSKTDYIMFGGIVIGGKNTNYIKWFIENNKGRKAHWLGFANNKFVKYFKPYSVDSSTMLISGQGFGRLDLYNFKGGFHTFSLRDLKKKNKTLSAIDYYYLDKNRVPKSKINQYLGSMKMDFLQKSYFNEVSWKSYILRDLFIENTQDTRMYKAMSGSLRLQLLIKYFKDVINEYKLETSIKEIL